MAKLSEEKIEAQYSKLQKSMLHAEKCMLEQRLQIIAHPYIFISVASIGHIITLIIDRDISHGIMLSILAVMFLFHRLEHITLKKSRKNVQRIDLSYTDILRLNRVNIKNIRIFSLIDIVLFLFYLIMFFLLMK